MRKSDREIRDFSEIVSVVGRCQVVRMGIYADDFPYVVPLTFAYEVQDGALVVYFHCATKGRKLDLLAKDARVCLEWDIFDGYVETGHSVTADYTSVIAFGRALRCEGEERICGIARLLEHTGFVNYSAETCAALPVVDVWKVVCKSVTGKRRFQK